MIIEASNGLTAMIMKEVFTAFIEGIQTIIKGQLCLFATLLQSKERIIVLVSSSYKQVILVEPSDRETTCRQCMICSIGYVLHGVQKGAVEVKNHKFYTIIFHCAMDWYKVAIPLH